MHFRARKVGLVADIERAFLNIAVDEQQRDLMRFLWIDDVRKDDPNIEIYPFCRVIFGMNCSPFLLNAMLRHHGTEYYESDLASAEYILSGLYVDDLTTGGEDDDEPYKTTNSCFTTGRFTLRKWASNEKQSLRRPQVTERDMSIMGNKNLLKTKISLMQRSPSVVLEKSTPQRSTRSLELIRTWDKTLML